LFFFFSVPVEREVLLKSYYCNPYEPVYNLYMKNSFDSNKLNRFPGHWLIKYQPEHFQYGSILDLLAVLESRLRESGIFDVATGKNSGTIQSPAAPGPYIHVTFDKGFGENKVFRNPKAEPDPVGINRIYVQLNTTELSALSFLSPQIPSVSGVSDSFGFSRWNLSPLKRIGLSYPILRSDKRWDSIHLTASSIFIGSSLTDAGYDVLLNKQNLPVTSIEPLLLDCDMICFTLFEDLFTQAGDFFRELKQSYGGLMAAGGPMITLNPMESAFHLPDLNLLVRGEAELLLPGLLRALQRQDIRELFNYRGFLFHVPGTIIISDLSVVNRVEDFSDFRFNLDFLEKQHLTEGLEINISRGCHRGCVFCSAVQGKKLRKLPVTLFDDLLVDFSKRLESCRLHSPRAHTVNINDDDILQEPTFAKEIFSRIKKNGFRLWGIQTSINSLYDRRGGLNYDVLDMIGDPSLYVDDNPLIWPGSDAFLGQRGKKMGKTIPSEEMMIMLLEELESRGIRNYHYWISSDHLSDWEEFFRESRFIFQLARRFTYFGLIAHSPFLVPYSVTPLYRFLVRSEKLKKQIKYKTILESPGRRFRFPLAERVETPYRHLNRLLNNERLPNRSGFFEDLNRKNYPDAFITLYNFLRMERMDAESSGASELVPGLLSLEAEVEEFISEII